MRGAIGERMPKSTLLNVHILRVEGHKNDIGERAGAPYDLLKKFHARICAVRGETGQKILTIYSQNKPTRCLHRVGFK